MNALVEVLRTIPSKQIGTVLHLGAGSFALEDYEAFGVEQLLLLTGDAETVAELQRRCPADGRAEVVPMVVAPASGPIAWHRYNLRMLDGPRPPSRWSAQFPRLQLQDVRSIDAVALQSVIEERIPAARPGSSVRVLAIDLPGQEDELVAAVRPELLRRFDWVVLRCEALADGPAAARLSSLGFEPVFRDVGEAPVWPVRLLRFDRRVHLELDLRRRLAESERRAGTLETQLLAAQTAAAAAAKARDETQASEAALAALRKQLAEAQGALAQLRSELADRDSRQRLVDAEVLKAQAQLELIKDVLLRERPE